VFDQINGLPVHALVLHFAVVFVPLLALGAIAYAVIPRWRPKIGWAVLALSIVAPITCFVTKESGEKLYDRTVAQGMKGKALVELNKHMSFGTDTFWWVLALGVVTLVMVLLTWRSRQLPMIASAAGGVVMVVLAVIAGYYVYRTGDSGATVVWNPQG
jgi:uncharacterized membrane protein